MNAIVVILSSLLIGLLSGLIFSIYTYPRTEVNKLVKIFKKEGYKFGEWKHLRKKVDHHFTDIVKPNCETLYSTSFITFKKGESYILSLPPSHHYLSVCFLNENSDVLYNITNAEISTQNFIDYILKDEKKPKVKIGNTIFLDSSFCWIIVRFGILDTNNLSEVQKLQDQIILREQYE